MIRKRGLLNLLLLVLVAWVGFRAYELLLPLYQGEHPFAKEAKKAAVVAIPQLPRALEPEKAYEDVMEKDLFRPERVRYQPPPVPPQPAAAPAPPLPPPTPPPPITLQGVIITGERKVALLKTLQKGTANQVPVVAAVGDDVAGARLESIEEGRVVLQWDKRLIELHVHQQRGQKSTNEGAAEKIPRLLNEDEAAKMPPKPVDQPTPQPTAQPTPAPSAVSPFAPRPAAAKGAEAGEGAPPPAQQGKTDAATQPAPARETQEPPSRPAPPPAPRDFPYSIFSPRR